MIITINGLHFSLFISHPIFVEQVGKRKLEKNGKGAPGG
jgi:hypothetical protein